MPEGDYGLYFTLFNFTYLFQIFNDFGIQNFNNRNISRHPQLLPKLFPNLLWLKGFLGVFYFIITAFFAWAVAGYDGRAMNLLFILLLNQIITQFIFFFRSNISGLGFYRTDSLVSSLDKFLMLFTCGFVLWFRPKNWAFSIELFAWAQTFALAATAVISFFLIKKYRTDFSIWPSWKWKRGKFPPQLIVLLKKSFPFALVILLMTAYTRLDAVLLERLLPDGKLHADVYAGAYRLLDAVNMLGYLFATLLLPMFAKLLGKPEKNDLRELVSLSFKMIWAGSITLAAAVFFARQDLVELMMPDRASVYRSDTLGVLIWVFVPVATTYIFSTLLTANENLMAMNRFFVLGLVLDVVLNLIFIPRFQAVGSAAATLGTQIFIAVAMVFLCIRQFKFRPSQKALFQTIGFAVFLLAADFFIFEKLKIGWPLKFSLALAAGMFGVFLFRILNPFTFASQKWKFGK